MNLASVGPTSRSDALDRMTQALEAAKRARDRGANVQEARSVLKEARSAFERGDFATAKARADFLLERLGSPSAPSFGPAAPQSPTGVPEVGDLGLAAGRLAEAAEAVKRAKARGFNVQVAKAALKQAKRALKARDYPSAVQLASQAIELSASTGRVRP